MRINASFFAVGLVMTLVSGAASAQAERPYIGLGVGKSTISGTFCSDVQGLFNPGFHCDSSASDLSVKIVAGYQINRHFALEASYLDFGRPELTANGMSGANIVKATLSTHPTGFGFDGVLTLPVSDEVAFTARGGLFAWSLDATSTVTIGVLPGVSSSKSDRPSGTSLDWGLGAAFGFDQDVGMRLEYQRFRDVGDANTVGKFTLELASVTLVYRFK